MRVESTTASNIYRSALKKTGRKRKATPDVPPKADSAAAKISISSRSLALESIKEKIKSGYYNRDDVAEDISDKLSKLFNRGL